MDFPECEQYRGKRRAYCRGERVRRDWANAWREREGLGPLPSPVGNRALATVGSKDSRKSCCRPRGKPGNELASLLKSLGIDSKLCSTGCGGYSAQMNQWGVTGCRERRAEIVQRLAEQRNSVDWMTQATVAAKIVTTGIYLMVNPMDPLGSLVDIAIMRAEDKERGEKCESGACAS